MESEEAKTEQVQTESDKIGQDPPEPEKSEQVQQPMVNVVHCCKCNKEGWYPSVGSVEATVLKRMPKLINGEFVCLTCLDNMTVKN